MGKLADLPSAPKGDKLLPIPAVLTGLAWLELIGGGLGMISFWPTSEPYGPKILAVAYLVPISWLMAGIICWAMFMAAAAGLTHLADISAGIYAIRTQGNSKSSGFKLPPIE